jgi:glycosyltransferase involved in cell wall biosynthesis
METLYHGTDPGSVGAWGEANGVRAELGIPDGVPLVGTVANFKPHKGQEHLLRAAAIVRRRIPDARFVLVGVGPREGQMRREADQLGLDGAVIFAGFRDDAPRVMRAFDVFVLPSENEGLPIALLEAMAQGRPVVATRVGGTPEVLQHGVQGLLVPPGSPEQLADAITTVLGDRAMRERMGDAGRSRSSEFDIRKTVGRMETVYQELLA